jgi:hypothetical protein
MWFRRRNGCRMSVETRFTISANVPEGLYDWLEAYAVARGVPKTVIIRAALEGFRELARGGVPHLPGDLDARREQPGLGGVLGLDRRGR